MTSFVEPTIYTPCDSYSTADASNPSVDYSISIEELNRLIYMEYWRALDKEIKRIKGLE